LQLVLRVGFALAGAGVAALAFHEWAVMPLPARLLTSVLTPSFLLFAFWQRLWRSSVRFVADPLGIYFPDNSQQVLTIGVSGEPCWLHVPWGRITRLRLARYGGEGGGSCIAFDVAVTDAQRGQVFQYVGAPAERPVGDPHVLHVAYDDQPPNPRRTLARLQALRDSRPR
jgi:hypothetical protein